jgi:acyl-CoA synthetase (AMP-forming)/AMP-acid ligase II
MPFIGEILRQNAAKMPDQVAVIGSDALLTYAQLNEKSDRLANSLKRMGIGHGDNVALLMKSSAMWLVSWYACQKLGAAAVLLHSRLLPDELTRMTKTSGASVLIYSPEYQSKAASIAEKSEEVKLVITSGQSEQPEYRSLSDLIDQGSAEDIENDCAEDAASTVLFTSGTTGVSKAIVRTQKMMRVYADVIVDDGVSFYGKEIMLTPAPLYHAAGLCCVVKMAKLAGTLVLEDCFCPDQICRQIERYRATQIALVPPRSYQRLKAANETQKCDFSSIRLAHITANHASRECMEDILTIFPNASLRLTWGSTEAANVTMSILTREQLRACPKLFNTVGRVNSVSEVRLVGEDGYEVSEGDVGEAWVRSPLVFGGYVNAPERNAECFRGDWFDTEDLMYRDSEGFYYMVGRKRDMIKTGGENVYAQEVEKVIRSHPAVSDCAVVAVPDAKYDEAVGAAVVLRPGCTLDGHELVEYCKKYLPSYKKPKYLAIMDKLPENSLGKVLKNVLRRDYKELFEKITE